MIESCADYVGADHPLPTSSLMRDGVSLDLTQAPVDRSNVRLDQATVAADQSLDADRFWCRKYTVPAGRVPSVVTGSRHQYRAAARVNALQQGREIIAADVTDQAQAAAPWPTHLPIQVCPWV